MTASIKPHAAAPLHGRVTSAGLAHDAPTWQNTGQRGAHFDGDRAAKAPYTSRPTPDRTATPALFPGAQRLDRWRSRAIPAPHRSASATLSRTPEYWHRARAPTERAPRAGGPPRLRGGCGAPP